MKKYDVVIVGAGIAGMTCAIFLKRYNFNVLLLEKEYVGGLLTKIGNIENYPGYESILGIDLSNNIYNQVKKLDIPVVYSSVTKIDNHIVTTNKESYEADYIVIASGKKQRKLGLEDNLIGKGISYCATCDGPLYKDREVIVLGGGASAFSEALYLSSICKKVTMIHRNETFKAEDILIKKVLEKDNIEIITNATITKINGEDKFESVIINNEKEIKADALFIYIGSYVDVDYINVDMEDNFIKVDDKKRTNIDYIYAIGDVIKKDAYQLVTAASDAVIAAYDIQKRQIKKEG